MRLQPQPGAVRRTERPAVPGRRQDLRQPRRGGGALRRVPDPGPGREAEQDRQAEEAVAQRGGARPQPVQLLLPSGLGDAERHLREARGPGAGLAAGRLLRGRRLGGLAGRRRARGPASATGSSTFARAAASTSCPAGWSWFRANHGDPDQVVIQLGTNRRKGFNEGDFRDTMLSLPASTPVLFLLPYRKFKGDNAGPVAATKKYAQMDAGPGLRPPDDLPVGLAEGRRLPPLLPGRRRAPRRQARGLVRALRRPRLGRCAEHLGLYAERRLGWAALVEPVETTAARAACPRSAARAADGSPGSTSGGRRPPQLRRI